MTKPDGSSAGILRLVAVSPEERGGLWWGFATFFCLLAGYYVLRPVRDELAVAGGVDRIPWLFTGTWLTMLAAVPIWSSLAARLPGRRLIPIVYRFFVANLIVFFVLFQVAGLRLPAGRAFFVWTSVFNLFVVSAFWSLMADIFHHEQGRRLFAFVAAGGSAGAIAGPLLTSLLVGHIGPTRLLLLAALLLEGACRCARGLGAWSDRRAAAGVPAAAAATPAAAESATAAATSAPATTPAAPAPTTGVGGSAWAAFRLVLTSPTLRGIALYVLLLSLSSTLGYMLQAHLVSAAGLAPAARTAYFARIDLMVNIGSAVAQAAVAGRVLTRFGVGPALRLSPLLAIAGSLSLAAAPVLATLVANQVIRRVAEYAISRPAREVLFTLVGREEKYKPKSLIDTVVYRTGDTAGSWIFASVAATLARDGTSATDLRVLALGALPFAVAWVVVAGWLTRRYTAATQGPSRF